MANWKENKIVGIIAGILIVLSIFMIVFSIIKSNKESTANKEYPPAVY